MSSKRDPRGCGQRQHGLRGGRSPRFRRRPEQLPHRMRMFRDGAMKRCAFRTFNSLPTSCTYFGRPRIEASRRIDGGRQKHKVSKQKLPDRRGDRREPTWSGPAHPWCAQKKRKRNNKCHAGHRRTERGRDCIKSSEYKHHRCRQLNHADHITCAPHAEHDVKPAHNGTVIDKRRVTKSLITRKFHSSEPNEHDRKRPAEKGKGSM